MRARLVAGAVALGLLAATLVASVRDGEDPITLTADFHDTTGLYVGNDVEYLGVPVGEVTGIDARGTSMRVHLELTPGTEVPADAAAVILQSSLVTDRYVELGPAYTGGPALAAGAHIPVEHTRSPATIDEITDSVDELVRALDSTTPKGRDIGDLLSVSADAVDGNGTRIRDALVQGKRALRTINGKDVDVRAVTRNLAVLVQALADRDRTIRHFADSVAASTDVVAEQRRSITATLRALSELTHVVTRFVRRNREVVGDDLARTLEVARVVRQRQASLAEAFDTMPTLAQNLAQAYDWNRGRLRVQFSPQTGPLSPVFRQKLCEQLGLPGCEALDPLFQLIYDLVPGDLP